MFKISNGDRPGALNLVIIVTGELKRALLFGGKYTSIQDVIWVSYGVSTWTLFLATDLAFLSELTLGPTS